MLLSVRVKIINNGYQRQTYKSDGLSTRKDNHEEHGTAVTVPRTARRINSFSDEAL